MAGYRRAARPEAVAGRWMAKSRRGRIFVVVSIADCQRVQTNWYRKRAEVLGGEVWTDGPLT